MKKTFLILLVLLCVATMAVASVSAAEDAVSDVSDSIDLDDNAIEPISSTESEETDIVADTVSDVCGTDDKSVGASPLKDGTTIYVSTTGDDSKDGLSEENAVATIAKGYELASDGSTINIAAGTYDQSSSITLDKSITINGADGAIINRAGTASVFSYSGDDALTFTLNNLIFTAPTKQNNPIINIGGAGDLKLNNCKLTNAVPGNGNGAIRLYYNAKATLDGCEFYGLNGTSSSAAPYLAISGNSIVEVKNSIFHDIVIPSGSFLRAVIYVNSGTANGTVSNCKFYNNSANIGGLIENKAGYLTVSNCDFEDNALEGGNVKGLIYVSQTTAAGNTEIIGNSFHDNNAAYAIWISAAPTTVEYNAFDLSEGQYAIGNNKNAVVSANYNFYGTNGNPSALLDNVTASNWVQMVVTPTEGTVASGEDITITADFSQYTDGTQTGTVPGAMAEVPVKFVNSDSAKGTVGEVQYDSNKAIVTYTGVAEGADTVTVTAASISTEIPITVTGGSSAGPIYVSKDGSDENAGTEDAPVASIAKAVELATAEGGSGKVIINEGTYTESGIIINGDLAITTVGEVILNGNGARYFDIKSGDVSIANVTMTNCNNSYGGAVIRITGGSLTIEDSNIIANGGEYRDNLIRVSTASLTLRNVLFENNTAHKTSTNYGGVYVSDGVLIVDNCTFANNFNKYGQIYVTGSSIGSTAVINNTNFIGNNATSASGGTGAAIYVGGTAAYQYSNGTVRPGAPSTVYVIDCDFIDNCAKGANYYAGQGGAIYVNNNASLYVADSRFVNNTCTNNTNGTIASQGGAIFASAGNVFITKSVFENNQADEGSEIYMKAYGKDFTTLNALNITNSIIIDDGESVIASNYTNGSLVANSNWWGSNANPADKVTEGITVDNWVIMNVDPTLVENALTGEPVQISVDFKHTNSTDGTVALLEGGLPQEFTVYGGIVNGTISESPVNTSDLEAQFIFTPEFAGANVVIVNTDANNYVPVIIYAAEPYTGPIYVSKDGDDANDGKEDSPVSTIAKAIELAQAGSGKIIINEGTYTESDFTITNNLEIAGEGQVVIDGNNEARIFTVNSGVENFTLKNVAITKANRNYGAVIYSTGANVLLDNVTLYENQATGGYSSVSLIYANGGSVEIDNSVIANHSTDGMIYISGADLVINNTVFDNNNANLTDSGTMGFIFATGTTSVSIEASNFTNNIDRQGLLYDSSSSNRVFIKDSLFDNNNATIGAGGVVHSNGKVNIINSVFTNNNAGREGGAIYLGRNADANVSKSVFINNTCANYQTSYNGDAISVAGKLNINYSVLLPNEGSAKALIFSENEDVAPNAQYNWWGTNGNPSNLVAGDSYYDDWEEEDIVCPAPDVSNWVVMTVSPATVEGMELDDTQAFTVEFTHYMDSTSTVQDLPDTIPELTVTATKTIGTLDKEEAVTVENEAVFTYTASAEGDEVITLTSTNAAIPISFSVVKPYDGPIYVSKDGDDANNGTEEAPVATIKKAIELAKEASGQVIINEGTYAENGINITSDLNITTVGDVIWDANGLQAFRMYSGDVYLSNITFINGNSTTYGHLFRVDGGFISVDGCKFISNGGNVSGSNGVIYVKNAMMSLTNSLFENNTASLTGTSYGILSLADSTLYVDNCDFINNNNKYGAIYFTASNVPSVAIINNTRFVGNLATASSGGQGAAIYVSGTGTYVSSYSGKQFNGTQAIVVVENCDFINNTANHGTSSYGSATSGKGGAIYVNNNATMYIKDSRFINNSALSDDVKPDGKVGGGAIYASAGNLQISNCVFDNNKAENGSEIYMYYYYNFLNPFDVNRLNITNSIINDNGSSVIFSDYTNGSLVANSNWWGSNDNPADKVTEGITVDNWVIMNVDPSLVTLTEAQDVVITIDFTHVTDAQGTISELEGTLPEEFTVNAMTMTGTLSANTVTTVGGVASVTFTPEESGESVAFIVYNGMHENVTVNVVGPYEGPIYVAIDGNDENPGSPDAPVATIAKAVELANAGVGQVIIREGRYAESNITLDSEKSITITGEGNVVIDGGESTDSIFYMHGGEATFANIEFTNDKANYGGAIRVNYARGGTSRNVIDINLTVDNCTFKDLKASSRGGAIYAWYTKGNMIIKDSEFSGMNTSGWGGAVCVGYSAYEDSLNFEVINSSFHDNKANNGGALYVYAETITIADSTFYNNNATYSPGAMYLYNCSATIDNCSIYDNHAKNTAAAIEVEAIAKQPIATLTITNSIIENNTGLDQEAAAINVDKATLIVSYSSLVNDLSINTVTATGYDAVYGQGIAIADNNWWGTNDPSTAVNGTNITMDKWVIMNVEANASDVVAGDEVKITVDFNHVNTTAGEIEELTGGVIPKESYTVVFTSENGTVAPQTVEVPKGESADVIFTASEPFATVTATSEQAIATLIFEGEIPEPYTGIVYVSKDGDDANNGSEDAPVSSIAKAIEIATAEGGSGQIIINEGTYNEHDLNITKDLTITGVGDVVIDGEGLGRLFFMEYGTQVDKFALSNVVLTGAKHNYGAAVYSFAKETELNNVTVINNPGAGDLITTYGDLTIKDSEISGHNGGDVIQSSGDATIILNNTLFKDNEVTASSSDYGIVYVSSGKGNLIVEDCQFINNTARQGIVIGASDTNITVKGSEFINNTNTVSYGGAIRAQSKLDVTESVFINNNAYRDGGAIYVGWRGDATITKSMFVNNSAGTGYHGDAIYNGNKATANYNIFLSNGTNYIIFNDGEDNVVNAQYNWWGTNDNPKDLNGKGTYEDDYWDEVDCADVDSSNWIIMNVEYDIEDVEVGAPLPITVDFNHYLDANGEIKELSDSLAQELDVSFISETGTFDINEVTTVGQVATGTYTIAEGANSITVKSSDASVAIEFEATTSIETNVVVSADSVWIGNPVNVLINVTDSEGNAVEGTVTLKFGDIEETLDLSEGIAAYTIPVEKLTAGVNTVNVAYNNVTPYTASEGTSTFMVLDGVVTKDTFQYYFDGENNYTLFGYVPEGATLDFQGDFLGAYTTNINKPVNIVSTTGDAFIETNKTGSFNILAGGSGTNVTGLKFLNTAFYITTAHDVTIDNIHMVANMNGVGSSTGFLSIRSNSSYVTVKNSYFENGGTGSSCLVIGKSSYCVIDHNVINATKNSGNIIYITTYVGTGDTPCYNNITNNVIESKVNSGFCYAIAVIGAYNLIENNTVNHPGSGIVQQSTWGAAPQPSGHNSYINNTLTGGCGLTAMVNSTVLDNNVAGAMTLNADCTAEGNTANTLTVSGANCIVKGNTINGAVTVAAAAKGTEMTGNTITGLVTVNSGENTITANDIRTSSEYAIVLKTGANNTVTDNTLYASEKVGDAAVKFTEGKDNLVQYNLPLSTELTVVVDDAIVGESSNINIKLVDAKGNSVSGIVKVTIGEDEYNVTVTDGKGSVSIAPFAQTGTYDVVASFNDEAYAPAAVETSVTVYGPGNVTVKHTDAGDAHDIQAAIDAANPGDVVQLGNYSYTDVADVNITKPVTLAGTEGTTITSTGDGTPIFNVPAISENGPESVNITGIDFKLANGDTVVKATADNDTNPLSIVTPSINIKENTFELVNETTVGESVTILELESERGILSPTGEISISGNEITAGINPFEFDVTSVGSGNDVNITPQNLTPVKKATRIIYKDMVTTAVDMGLDGRVGEWFNFTLVDEDGTPIPNTPMEIGFNGKIYNSENEGIITDENGTARLQINLGSAGSNTFAISFLGNDEYDASFAVARINVTAQKGTLTVPNKSYSASAKTKSLTATLKSASGKAVRNKEIVFIVDGKYYSAKTNANGVATVKVSLNKKGTYKFSVMFNHDVRYAPINKTATLTIK